MKTYEFYLTYQNLGGYILDDEHMDWSDAIAQASEFEATILENTTHNTITMWFMTEADCAQTALTTAIEQIRSTKLKLKLQGVAPELVSVKQLSLLFGVSRQSIQAYMSGKRGKRKGTPPPPYPGCNDTSLWYLSDAANWLSNNENNEMAGALAELGQSVREINSSIL